MAESMQSDDLLSYINEELITNSSTIKNEFDEDLYSDYIKSENNKNENTTLSLTEKNKIELAQASIYNSITHNVYNQGLPLSPPEDDINSPNAEIYLNSQNISSNPLSISSSPSMEIEALSPSSMGSEVNDVNNIKNEEQNLMNLTQLYQNSGIITTDGLINPSLLANQEFINNNVLLNAMYADDSSKSQLFQVLPNTNISIPSTTYLNDPLSTINLSLPTNTNIPVTLNSNLTLPTVTVPSNTLEFEVQPNSLNLDNTLATTNGLDINTLQSLSPLAMSGPLALTNTNTSTISPSTIINAVSNAVSTSSPTTISTTSSTLTVKPTETNTTSSSVTSTTTSNPPLSATLDLTSLKSSVNETLELTKKLSQANNNNNNSNNIIPNKDGKSNVIDVTDILKSDVAASCLNLLKGSKGKPGRKKKCLQNQSDANSTTTSTNTTPSTTTRSDIKPFPYLKSLNPKTETTINNGNTGNTDVNALPAQSVKFPIIKPKLNAVSTNDNHTPILPLAPSTAKPNTINCFNNPLLSKASTTKPLNPTLLRNPPILPNGSTDKNSNNSNNNNTIKTAYQKRQERLLKNREAAHLSRKRKREQLHMLETHAQELIAENQTLKLKVIELEQLNEKLVKENELLKMKMNVKKEIHDESETVNDNMSINNEIPSDIYNLYIKPEALTNSSNSSVVQNNTNNKSKEIGIVFMVILFSFSLFTFPLSIFTAKNNTEVGNSIISTFMNKLSDFSLASIPSENTGKILSSSYEQDNQYLLDSGHYEIADVNQHKGELELSSISRRGRRHESDKNIDMDLEDEEEEEKEKGQLTQFNKKSRKMKNSRSNNKSKQKHNTTRKNIKKNYEYTTYNELSSLMSVFHPNNVDLDKESLKQMSLLRHWIVEGFCSIHENHTYAKNSSIVKDIVKVHDNKGKNGEGSTDLTVKKNGNSYYDSSKSYSKEIPWNMKQFIRFYPDTTYFYSPKLVQLFPLSPTEIMEPSIPFINNLQSNDTVTSESNTEENRVSPSSSRFNSSTSSYYGKKNEERQVNDKDNQTGTKTENQNNENVYQLPFSNKPKMAIITNLESDDINEESNSYLMIDFEIKGARLIENE